MAEKTQTAPPAAGGQGDAEATRVASIDDKISAAVSGLKDDILGEVRKLVGAGREGGPAQSAAEQHEAGKLDRPSRSLDEMVAEAIKVNDQAREREQKERDAAERLAKVEAATAEQPPVDRRRVHRFMGWGDPAK